MKIFCGREALQEILQAVVRRHAHARKSPAAEIAKTCKAGLMGHIVERGAAGVCRSNQSADAGAGYEINGDFILLERTQNADVGDATCESAAERDAYFRPFAGTIGKRAQSADCLSEPFGGDSPIGHNRSLEHFN